MASLIDKRDLYDIATGNDADSDRHGIVTPDSGLMNPNHYLAVAIQYLYGGARPGWRADGFIGKTLVSSSMIDRVAADLGRRLVEVPVGFKWFVPGLLDGSGPLRRRGVGRCILPAQGRLGLDHRQGRHPVGPARLEIQARTGKSPSEHYAALVAKHGDPAYARIDAPANREQKAKLAALSPMTSQPIPLREKRSRPSSRRRPATVRPSAGSRSSRSRRGSRRVRRGPRTSTRSMRSPSRAPSTWRRCRPRPRRSSAALGADPQAAVPRHPPFVTPGSSVRHVPACLTRHS